MVVELGVIVDFGYINVGIDFYIYVKGGFYIFLVYI